MRAILVSVDFADILALTLPWNRDHFTEVMVVTAPWDEQTKMVARQCGAEVFETDAFWRDGAAFNKFLALEQGLDRLGRRGWLAILDADVLWPKSLGAFNLLWLDKGCLHTPRRRMDVEFHRETGLPPEDRWHEYPLHPQQREFAGYTQIFHADDPHLGQPPWHETDWRHAGGGDSIFQAKWPDACKVRPPFEVLHLGPAGVNWMGRAMPYLDGSTHQDAAKRRVACLDIWAERRRRQEAGLDRFGAEKLGK